MDLIPDVCKQLKKQAELHMDRLIQWFTLISTGKFNFENICYLMFTDYINFCSVANTSSFRNLPQVRLFLETGNLVVGSCFGNFLRGPKYKGMLKNDLIQPGYFDPSLSKINFPVPKYLSTNKNSVIPKTIPVGWYNKPLAKMYLNQHSINCEKGVHISLDAKRLNSSREDALGAVDMVGFEPSPTKNDREKVRIEECLILDQLIDYLNNCRGKTTLQNCVNFPSDTIMKVFACTTERIKNIREKVARKKYLADCLIEQCKRETGKTNWQDTRFQKGVSRLKTYVYDAESNIQALLHAVDILLESLSMINGTSNQFIVTGEVNLESQTNYVAQYSIDDQYANEPRSVLQGSDKWKLMRKQSVVTGSTLNNSIGKKLPFHYPGVLGDWKKKCP